MSTGALEIVVEEAPAGGERSMPAQAAHWSPNVLSSAGRQATATISHAIGVAGHDVIEKMHDVAVASEAALEKRSREAARAAAKARREAARALRKRRAKKLEPVPWYIVHPGSSFKVLWDSFAVVILIYTVVIAPLKLGFDVEDYCGPKSQPGPG